MMKRIPLDQITRNPDQPRQHFDQTELESLAASIDANGLAQPITVRPMPKGSEHRYMIVMGERRFRAHLILQERGKADSILAHVRAMDDLDMDVNAILENLQRAGISPIEEAAAYQRAIDTHGLTVADLGKRLGITQLWRITDRLRLLGLTPENRALVSQGIVTVTQAYHMASLSPNGQRRFLAACKSGAVGTNTTAAAVAAKIAADEAQIGLPMDAPAPVAKRAPAKPVEDKVDAVGQALGAFFRDGELDLPALDGEGAARCLQKVRALRGSLGTLERALAQMVSLEVA